MNTAAVNHGWGSCGPGSHIILVRHGATDYSLEKRFSGRGGKDLPLNEAGLKQAESVAACLSKRGYVSRIVTSPLTRARMTAERIAQACDGAPVEVREPLAECSFGVWDGYTFSEISEMWPRELKAWRQDRRIAPPGGESLWECDQRVWADFIRLASPASSETVVVGHVSTIKVIVARVLGAPLDSVFRMELAPASITRIAHLGDGRYSMVSFGEVAHLADATI